MNDFLPLGVRRVLYVVALAGAAVAPVIAVTQPEYAGAIVTGSSVLSAAALGTALANPSRSTLKAVPPLTSATETPEPPAPRHAA